MRTNTITPTPCLALVLLVTGACGGTGAIAGDAALTDGPASAGISDTTRFMASCSAFNHACTAASDPDCGQCQYRIRFDRARCSAAQPCDDLFLVWSAMGCEADRVQGVLDGILAAHPDYVTACVQPLYPGEQLPSSLGAPERDAAVMAELFTALRESPATGVWSGANLLMTGCSAGASRYPVVAARYPDDAQWLGSAKTAVCFSDGVVSIDYQDTFIGEAIGTGGMSCPGRHQRIASAYTVASPVSGHACSGSPQGQCACDPAHAFRAYPGDCENGDCVAFDSIVTATPTGFSLASGVTTDRFAVPSWRLVSEGDSFRTTAERCERDIVPEAPFRALCDVIDADPEETCSFVSLPDAAHCSAYWEDIGAICVDWFEAL